MINERVAFTFLAISFCMLTCHVDVSAGEPEPFDVVITEIMADPSPSAGLPEFEYIEIFNRGKVSLNLEGWKLSVGSHNTWLPNYILPSGSYAVICDQSAESMFAAYGAVIPVDVFPPVLNSGQIINLTYNSKIITSVNFSSDWYGVPEKSEGGWSLEIIDPDNLCGGINNWNASMDHSGGTPSQKNSIDAHNPDFESPFLLRALVPADSIVELLFSEPLSYVSLRSGDNYSVNYEFLQPDSVICDGVENNQVQLRYPENFMKGIIYTVSVRDDLTDCAGNPVSGILSVNFGLPEQTVANDIIFNEILFDSDETGAEFIELYNRSDKILNLADLSLSLSDAATGSAERTIDLGEYPFLLLPHGYAVLTRSIRSVLSYHPTATIQNLVQIPLFTLPNDEGMLVLENSEQNIIDEFKYKSLMHHPLLQNTKGISLERINSEIPSGDPQNWESASSSSHYASPGLQNSQESDPEKDFRITLSSEFLSPDDDGIDDQIVLYLQLPDAGWIGSAIIYNINGVPVKTLFADYLLGTGENFSWDGKYGDGKTAEMGIYIISGEFFNKKGGFENFKKVIAVVKK